MPNLARLAVTSEIGAAQTIPPGMSPGSDVGNMAILGFDPSRYHTGRAPIEAAAMGVELRDDQVAYRCNLVTVTNGVMTDFAGGHPTNEQAHHIIEKLNDEFATDQLRFYPGVEYRHIMVTTKDWSDARCIPPHDLTDRPIKGPSGSAAKKLQEIMDQSQAIVARAAAEVDARATQVWLWGQGAALKLPSFTEMFHKRAALTSAVDIIRGLGVLADIEVLHVEGVNAGFDTDYGAQAKAALDALRRVDVVIVHVESTDEAAHQGLVDEKIRALELLDEHLLGPLLDGTHEDFRFLLMPDHATPCATKSHTSEPVPYLLFDSTEAFGGGAFTEKAIVALTPVPAQELMPRLLVGSY